MDFKQSTINEILVSEKEMVLRGAERYGAYYDNASEFINLLNNGMIKSIDHDRYVFAIFLAQTKKHLTLAFFSALRLHYVQTMMNLRQVLEAGGCAAYAIANIDPDDFADEREDGTLDPTQKLTRKRYAWLDNNYPAGSAAIKGMKDGVNEIGTHSNIITAQQNFKIDLEAGLLRTPFFDYEDEMLIKTDLWQIANIALGIMDLFYGVNLEFGVIKIQENWSDKFKTLANENMRLKEEMLEYERLKKFIK